MHFLENKEMADVYYSHDGAHYEQVCFAKMSMKNFKKYFPAALILMNLFCIYNFDEPVLYI